MAHERTFFPSPAAVYGGGGGGRQQDPPYQRDFASRSQSPSRQQMAHDFMHYNRRPSHAADPAAAADTRPAPASFYDSDNSQQQMGQDGINNNNIDEEMLRSTAKLKADIISHPLYEHLLRAHIQCLNTAGLPPDQARALEDHLATNAHRVAIKYLMLSKGSNSTSSSSSAAAPDMKLLQDSAGSPKEIDEFMENYLKVLIVLRRHLEELVIPSTNTAMDALCELEQAFYDLTGLSSRDISPIINGSNEQIEESTFDFEADESEYGIESSYDIDRSLFEYVRMELKQNLKERYRESITAIRDEIIRKRQAGKLPGDVTILKRWWNAHSKWPYPTEEEKKKLMEETGLEMRQINNWFINHRKRNWNHRASPRPPSTGSSSNNFSPL